MGWNGLAVSRSQIALRSEETARQIVRVGETALAAEEERSSLSDERARHRPRPEIVLECGWMWRQALFGYVVARRRRRHLPSFLPRSNFHFAASTPWK